MKKLTVFAVIAALIAAMLALSVSAEAEPASDEAVFDAQIIMATLSEEEMATLEGNTEAPAEETSADTDAETTADDTTVEDTTAADTTDNDTAAEETTAEAGSIADGLTVTPSNFVNNLSYMGLGMLGIFIVIALIMGVTTVLNKAFSGSKNDKQ